MIRVLIANNIGPILLIAFTNHALDNILHHVLEKKITTKIVRLGFRSADEVVSQYTLANLSKNFSQSKLAKAAGREYYELKSTEEEMKDEIAQMVNREVAGHNMDGHISREYPNHHDELQTPPFWIQRLFQDGQE